MTLRKFIAWLRQPRILFLLTIVLLVAVQSAAVFAHDISDSDRAAVSQIQGHGKLMDRLDDFAPVLRYPNRVYRTQLQPGTVLLDPTIKRAATAVANAIR